MIMCLCWKCHLVAPFYPSQTALGYVKRVCQRRSRSGGEDICKDTGKRELFFLFGFKALNGTAKALSAFYFIMSLNRVKNQCPRGINRSKALSFTMCNRAGIVSWTLWDVSLSLSLFRSHTKHSSHSQMS